MNGPYKEMYYKLFAEMVGIHLNLQTHMQNLEKAMQETEELFISAQDEQECAD